MEGGPSGKSGKGKIVGGLSTRMQELFDHLENLNVKKDIIMAQRPCIQNLMETVDKMNVDLNKENKELKAKVNDIVDTPIDLAALIDKKFEEMKAVFYARYREISEELAELEKCYAELNDVVDKIIQNYFPNYEDDEEGESLD